MKDEDLEYMYMCIEALQACTIILNPICAVNTMKLIEIKSSF